MREDRINSWLKLLSSEKFRFSKSGESFSWIVIIDMWCMEKKIWLSQSLNVGWTNQSFPVKVTRVSIQLSKIVIDQTAINTSLRIFMLESPMIFLISIPKI